MRTTNACEVCGRVDYPHICRFDSLGRPIATHTYEWCDECECYEPIPVKHDDAR